jgi:hypothetical protein
MMKPCTIIVIIDRPMADGSFNHKRTRRFLLCSEETDYRRMRFTRQGSGGIYDVVDHDDPIGER